MLRLKGNVVYGELDGDWLKFDVNQIDGVAGDGIGLRVRSSDRNIFIVDPSTIQPADDPRKQMLDEIRDRFLWLFGNNKTHSIISRTQVNLIIDEMEANCE